MESNHKITTSSLPVSHVMSGLWTDDRNRMSTELVKAEICLKMNFSVNCQESYKMVLENKRLLESARSSNKHKF